MVDKIVAPKMLNDIFDDILNTFIPEIRENEESLRDKNILLRRYYSECYQTQVCEVEEYIEQPEHKVINKENNYVEYVILNKHKTDFDKTLLDKINDLEHTIIKDESNLRILKETYQKYLDELSSLEDKFHKTDKSRKENLSFLLESGALVLPEKKSFWSKFVSFFGK